MRKRSKKCLKMHVECTKRERRMSILLSDEEQLIVILLKQEQGEPLYLLIIHTFKGCMLLFGCSANKPSAAVWGNLYGGFSVCKTVS